jgi:ketosteroid isomerase-like protein
VTSNADVARHGFAAIARGDFDAISEFLDPEVKWHGGHVADGCQNRGQVLAWLRDRGDREAGPVPELVDVVAAGDRVAVILQSAATDEDPQPRRTANLTLFRDGRAVEMVHYADAEDALAALGPPRSPEQ